MPEEESENGRKKSSYETNIRNRTIIAQRELNPDDAGDFFNLNENPNVIKYTGDKAFQNIDGSPENFWKITRIIDSMDMGVGCNNDK